MKRKTYTATRVDALTRLLRDMDPELLNAMNVAERERIASLIELKEGPGRFL